MNAILLWTMLAPLVLGLLLTTVPRDKPGVVKGLAFLWSLLTLGLSLVAAARFNWSRPALVQFADSHAWVAGFGLRFGYGADALSLWLVLLTTFVTPLAVLASWGAVRERVKEFYVWVLVLEAATIGTFIATDVVFFYACFELTLVPMFFLIGIYGGGNRARAARAFFLYAFTGSMLTLAGVLYVAWSHASRAGAWSFALSDLYAAGRAMSPAEQGWVFLALLAGFAVKVPIFPFHTWLPLAHAEARAAGSVDLVIGLLKLGVYGLLRFALPMTPDAAVRFAPWLGVLAVVSVIYAGLIAWAQRDLKKLIAYASVSHLGFCVLGLFALNPLGLTGSALYMINHALATGAMFLCVGMMDERLRTHEISEVGGLARVMPLWACFMVFFGLASVALPGLNGFVSEFLTLAGAFTSDGRVLGPWYAALAGLGIVLGAIYTLSMLGRVVWGPLRLPADPAPAPVSVPVPEGLAPSEASAVSAAGASPAARRVRDLTGREVSALAPLAVACLVLGLYPAPLLQSLGGAMKAVGAPVEAAIQRLPDTPVPEMADAAPSPRPLLARAVPPTAEAAVPPGAGAGMRAAAGEGIR